MGVWGTLKEPTVTKHRVTDTVAVKIANENEKRIRLQMQNVGTKPVLVYNGANNLAAEKESNIIAGDISPRVGGGGFENEDIFKGEVYLKCETSNNYSDVLVTEYENITL